MGTNYYLIKKKKYEPKDDTYTEQKVYELNNGWVWNNTYYPSLDDLNKEYYLELHIGKSSCGWHFGLCIYPEFNINSLEDWLKEFDENEIKDEYDKIVSKQDMFETITNRKHKGWEDFATQEEYEKSQLEIQNGWNSHFNYPSYITYDDFLRDNHAKRGLNGLLAHDSYYYEPIVTGGTYDLTKDWNFS